jgi:hypothetical protein
MKQLDFRMVFSLLEAAMNRLFTVFWVGICLVFMSSNVFAVVGSDETIGQLRADLPSVVDINQPFYLTIWFEPKDKKYTESIEVRMKDDVNIYYKEKVFVLKPFLKKTITTKVLKSKSGLAVIKATSIGCTNLEKAVNAGFVLNLSVPQLKAPIESETHRNIIIDCTDTAGLVVPLGSKVKFNVKGYNAKFSTLSRTWSDKITYEVKEGSNAGYPLVIRPSSTFSPEKGMIHVDAIIDDDTVLRSENIEFSIQPAQRFLLLMSVIGGILYGVYAITKEILLVAFPLRWLLTYGLLRIFTGAITGAISYFLVDWDIIGIKFDTTTAKGFVVLGFMFSYVGIDAILRKIAEVKKQPKVT